MQEEQQPTSADLPEVLPAIYIMLSFSSFGVRFSLFDFSRDLQAAAVTNCYKLIAVAMIQERVEGAGTPSSSSGEAQRDDAQRAPVQSPVGAATGEKAKTVFNSILSPVLTLFQGKQEDSSQAPTVVLQVWRHSCTAALPSHCGPHVTHCSWCMPAESACPIQRLRYMRMHLSRSQVLGQRHEWHWISGSQRR